MSLKKAWLFLLVGLVWAGCEQVNPNWKEEASNPEFLHRSMKTLTDVIVHDIFSPPVASRIYVYPSIAAYEILQNDYPEYASLEGQLNDFKEVPKPQEGQAYCYPLAAVHAFLTVGKALIFSEDQIEAFEQQIYQEFKDLQMPKAVYERSMAFGKQMADHILAWADKDMYKETRTFPKYTITDDPARWKPTPPDYMDGIEPHWNKIRTMVIKGPDQFAPPPPTPFSTDPNSQFYKEVMEVYTALQVEDENERKERQAIAEFWDCNPYVSHHKGHVMFATKKITPGGHWMGITTIACRTANADIMKSAEAYAWTSIALFDAFISCWDEKYRSNLVRPETVINTYIDEDWTPHLQTPPFPEYTSGHSVISRAAAVALTHVFGDNFKFKDTVEEEFGLPARSFNSFLEASSEAAISRLYGGIHYAPACFIGVQQGEQVGKYITQHLKTREGKLGMK
ncbi:MAG: phosphatase PAP2 family protein [Bacteroidetes bacterium]|nr:MAG: phosphatase PAP2 family protein [Bacteroidota bacterium]